MSSEQTIFLLRDKPIVELDPKQLQEHNLSEELFGETSTEEYETLKADIEHRGIQDPLQVISQGADYLIISGHRRSAIAKELGIKVPCIIRTDLKEEWQIKEALIKDNLLRRHLNDYQKVKCGLELEPIERLKAEKRKLATLKKGDKIPDMENFPIREEEGATRDKVAKNVGFGSGRQYEKAKKVYQEAPEPIKKQWQEDKITTHNAYSQMKRITKQKEDEKRLINQIPQKKIEGVFKTILIDPPWDYEHLSLAGRGKPKYAVLSIDELKAFDIQRYVDKEGCHLYLWTTNNFLYEALKLGIHWGFTYKTALTWIKPSIGLGSYFRNNTEHCLFFVSGKLTTRVKDIPTSFEAPRAEHSKKPEKIYEIIERASYPPYLQIFFPERENWETFKGDIRN